MDRLKYLLEKEIHKESIAKQLNLSTYHQRKILKWEPIKRIYKRVFSDNVKEFINELSDVHMEDVL